MVTLLGAFEASNSKCPTFVPLTLVSVEQTIREHNVCHPWGSNSSHSTCKAKSVGMSYRKYYVIDYILHTSNFLILGFL